jgi:hypothetical protein
MGTTFSWQKSYKAALVETDWTRMVELVQAAESEIHKRRLELSKDHTGTQEEREGVVNALNGLAFCEWMRLLGGSGRIQLARVDLG